MADAALTKKLVIKPGNTVRVINAPEQYEQLENMPEGADEQADVVLLFGESRDALERSLPTAITTVHRGGVFWVVYPKGGKSDLSRNDLWAVLEPFLWRPVSQVSVDDTWSALRFRPAADVKSSKSKD
jgi:hypothetical protein